VPKWLAVPLGYIVSDGSLPIEELPSAGQGLHDQRTTEAFGTAGGTTRGTMKINKNAGFPQDMEQLEE
jgi:hypothetical protein